MIHIFDISDHEEIRKIKAGYFDKIIDEDNCVVICSPEFKFLLDFAINGRMGRDAGTRLRHVWSM